MHVGIIYCRNIVITIYHQILLNIDLFSVRYS